MRRLAWALLQLLPRRDLTLPTWNGRLTFDSHDAFMGRELFVQRQYDRGVIVSAMGWLEKGGWIVKGEGLLIDVGANIGAVSTTLIGHGWLARSLAFEPHPNNLRLLRLNIEQNHITDRVTPIGTGLSSAAGQFGMEINARDFGDNRILTQDAVRRERSTAAVSVDTLDHVLAEHPAAAADVKLIWMDIQGHEIKCLEGAVDTLARRVPVVMEFWPHRLAQAGTTQTQFVAFVRRYFARIHSITESGVSRCDDLNALFNAHREPRSMTMILLEPA